MSTTTPRNLLAVVLIWAAVYLPGLGALEIHGDEVRRILPAETMLETGDYILPQLLGRPYLKKPPLINWLVAGSFQMFAVRNEWTARFPSALLVLSVAIAFVVIPRRSLGPRGSVIAALCWLTSNGVVENGRAIEIEAIYASFFALAFIFWLAWWQEERSPWLTWTVPWMFLGLGLLAKGPPHLLMFYALVLVVLWRNKRLRALWRAPHFVGVSLMLAIFAAWAVPLIFTMSNGKPSETWWDELRLAFAGRDYVRLNIWIWNLPSGLLFFFPAACLLPFIRYEKITDPRQRLSARALALSSLLIFMVVLLLPGSFPRYAVPLIAVPCWLIGLAFANDAFAWHLSFKKMELRFSARVVTAIVCLVAIPTVLLIPLRSLFFNPAREHAKVSAARINAVVPATETLFVVNPPLQPFLFYVRAPIRYVRNVKEIPAGACYFLARAKDHPHLQASPWWRTSGARLVDHTHPLFGHSLILYELDDRS